MASDERNGSLEGQSLDRLDDCCLRLKHRWNPKGFTSPSEAIKPCQLRCLPRRACLITNNFLSECRLGHSPFDLLMETNR